MFKLKFKTIAIAIAILSIFLLSFAGNSEALQITTLEPAYGSYDSDYAHTVYLETDRPYYVVQWYVDGVYAWTSIGGLEGDEDGPTSAFFCTDYLSGSVTGTPHAVEAIAWDQEDHSNTLSDSDSYTFYIFEPTIVEVEGDETDVEATLTVHRHYYRHPMVYADLSASAYNPLDEDEIGKRLATRYVAAEFKLTVSGPNVNVVNTGSAPRTKLPSLESVGPASASLYCSIAEGIAGRTYTSRAYVAIDADGPAPQNPDAQDYLEYIDGQTFTREDD